MGQNSSIHTANWKVAYNIPNLADGLLDRWRISFRGYMYVAIIIATIGLSAANILSYFARRKRLRDAIDLLIIDDRRRQYAISQPLTRNNSEDSFSSLNKSGKSAKSMENYRVSVLPVDMSRSNSSSTISNHSYGRSLSVATRYAAIPRTPMALKWAAAQAFLRTHFTWRRVGFGSYDAAIGELSWFLIYLGCMFLLGFLFLPETTQYDNTNVTIHRCSSLAVSQIPFVIGLASKNNVISWCTGISYERLNFLHRNSARVLFLFAWYHTIGHVYLGMTGDHKWDQLYVACGMVAFLLFNFLVVLSWRPVRNRIYEIFYYSHITLAILFMVFLMLHRLEYRVWIAAGLFIFFLDRFARLARLFALNRFWLILSGNVLTKSTARAELVSKDLIRLTIDRNFGWKSGKHAFLCLPTVSSLPFEMHPFTIASLRRLDQARSPEVNFFIRVCNGMTKELARRITQMDGVAEVPCLVDGPYGISKSLDHFDEVLLVSGGTGVSYTFNRLSELAAKRLDRLTSVRKVTFVWVVRNFQQTKCLEELLVEIIDATPPGFLDLQIYVTDKGFGRQCEKGRSAFGRLGRYLKAGRPQMQRLVWNHLANKGGQVAIHCCGPSALSDSARIALADILSPAAVRAETCAAVDLHIETFGF